ncbi:MAG: hypothetical protein KKE69_06505 [Alphaproteobacteria bacterium]|nr:hypothetical protein [Alphaproteobacteria bacterium]MBU1605414.1 hypothetical protein [Alphaproteobacteria bacterium]
MATPTLQSESANANPPRIDALNQHFSRILSTNEFEVFMHDRWPAMSRLITLSTALAQFDRAELLERARGMAKEEGPNGQNLLVAMLSTVCEALDFCNAQREILESVHARLFIVADDLLLEQGQRSVLAEA